MSSQELQSAESLMGVVGSYKVPTILIAVGLIVAVLGFQWALRYDLKQSEKAFQDKAGQVYQSASSEIQRHANILDSMSHILGQMNNLSEQEFKNVSAIFAKSTYFIDFYYYRFYAEIENASQSQKENGLEEYFSSVDDLESDTNFEGLAEIQAAIQKAKTSATIIVSQPYHVVRGDLNRTMVAMVAPSTEENNNELFLIGIFDVQLFFHASTMNTQDAFNMRVVDVNIPDSAPLYEYIEEGSNAYYPAFDIFNLDFMKYSRDLYLGRNKLWNLILVPSVQADLNYIGLLPWIVFASIIAITILLSYIVFRATTEKISAQSMVEKQTKSLRNYAARLEMSNRDLDDFAYVASHDLKEPLRGLYNYAEILEEDYSDKLDEDGRHKLRTLKMLSKRMESLIVSLFEYSKISRIDMARERVNLSKVVEDVVELMHIWLEENGAEVVVVTELPTIECDPVRVGEVFRNLITNGVKYNEHKNKRIEIGCNLQGDASRSAPVFWVRDNGIGIAPEHQDYVFKIFKRLHERDLYGGGTGAGLTITWRIVQRHGGKIWLESQKGMGSTFYFTLQGKKHDKLQHSDPGH